MLDLLSLFISLFISCYSHNSGVESSNNTCSAHNIYIIINAKCVLDEFRQKHTHIDIVSTGASTCRGAGEMFLSGGLPVTYPYLMWLTQACLLLSLQAGIAQWLQLLSLVLNSTHFKMPNSIYRQEEVAWPAWALPAR